MDEGLIGEKGHRLSCLSLSCLLQQIVWCMMVHRQSVNGKGEEVGLGGKGAEGRGKGEEERRKKIEKVKKMDRKNNAGEAVVSGKVSMYSP